MADASDDIITIGSYVIVEKKNLKKVYKVSAMGTIKMGRDNIEMSAIVGKPFWTTFRIVQLQKFKQTFTLEVVNDNNELFEDLKEDLPSGIDNRMIIDDGNSQKLSKEEILSLQESGKSGIEIINKLIENSTSFTAKTEYSQEKYILKKKRKYCSYLTIHKPTIPYLHEINLRSIKGNSLRMDVLSQILSYSDVQAEGLYMLYDSSTLGLTAASLLNRIGANTSGKLIHFHLGQKPSMSTIKHMNFPTEQVDRFTGVNIYHFLKLHAQNNCATFSKNHTKDSEILLQQETKEVINENTSEETAENSEQIVHAMEDLVAETTKESDIKYSESEQNCTEIESCESITNLKRKIIESQNSVDSKKIKWFSHFEERALQWAKSEKARSLVIIAKEHPLNIAKALLPFLGLSRPFVIYHVHREPLLEMYVELKQRYDVANLKLLSNFLRSYQVLPDRTHPDIDTNDCSGYLLTGYLVSKNC